MKKVILILSISILLVLLASCNFYKYEDSDKYVAGGAEISSEITKLEVDWTKGDISITYHDKEMVAFDESANDELEEKEKLHYYLEGTTLHIKYAKSGIIPSTSPTKELVISLPKGILLNEVEINSVSADVKMEQPYFQNKIPSLEIETVSGDIELDLMTGVQDITIDTVSGNINASSKADSLEIEAVSGDINFSCNNQLRECSISTTSGNVNLGLISTADFTLEKESVSGDFSCELEIRAQGNRYICGNGSGEYEIDTVSGDINIYVCADVDE